MCNSGIILEIEGPMMVIVASDPSQAFEDDSFGHRGRPRSTSPADHQGVRVTYHKVEHSAVSTARPRHWKISLGFESDLDVEVAASQLVPSLEGGFLPAVGCIQSFAQGSMRTVAQTTFDF